LPTRAFILIETQVGKSQEMAAALTRMEGVKSADVITGTYDVISLVKGRAVLFSLVMPRPRQM